MIKLVSTVEKVIFEVPVERQQGAGNKFNSERPVIAASLQFPFRQW